MPNWVYNSLTVTGPAYELAAVREQLNASYTRAYNRMEWDKEREAWSDRHTVETVHEPELSFWNIIRPSDDIMDEYVAVHRKGDTRTGWVPDALAAIGGLLEEVPDGDISNHWYDWNVRNWGTKWDASDVEFQQYEDDHLHYRFSTAWSPPHEAILCLSAQFINAKFYLEYEEEQGWGGENEYISGGYTNLESWDIPDSHEDNTKRDRPCVCEWEPDDPEYWYDDCPRETVAA